MSTEYRNAHIHDDDEGRPIRYDTEATKSQMMSKRTLEWTTTKTPANSVGMALERGIIGFDRMQMGIRVKKVAGRGGFRDRVLTLSTDKYALFCTHQPVKKGEGAPSTIASKLSLPVLSRKGVSLFASGETLRDRYVRYIDIADIDFVQVGVVGSQKLESARTKNRLKGLDSKIDEQRAQIVTIGHHGDQTLDVVVPDKDDRVQLVRCLSACIRLYSEARRYVSNEALLLRYIWYDVDVNRDGLINDKEFLKLLTRINFDPKNPKRAFNKFLTERKIKGRKSLEYHEIMALLQVLKKENDSMANRLWDELFDERTTVVGAVEFMQKFAHGPQGASEATEEDVEDIFEVLNTMELNHREGEPEEILFNRVISRARFEVFLYSELNSAYSPWAIKSDEEVKLDSPMSEYWINSSHNTYLTGDQLRSTSSVEMYLAALRRGARCLELDVWDGEKHKDGRCFPVVYHGHTITSKILFVDIIRAVKAFIAQNPSTYPIILSLENHCSHSFQMSIASTLTRILDDCLYRPTILAKEKDLPSPESLRGKVVIKGKRPPAIVVTAEGTTEVDDDVEEEDPYELTNSAIPESKTSKKKTKDRHPKIVKELAQLTLFHGTKYKDFEVSILEPTSHMHSISETKIDKIVRKSGSSVDLWRKYNVRHMTRTYPAGTRVDSSNYSPILAHYAGCQLVALNFQYCDNHLIVNDGLFRQNVGAGYLRKPKSIMADSSSGRAWPIRRVNSLGSNDVSTIQERDVLDVVMESVEGVVCGSDEATPSVIKPQEQRENSPKVKDRLTLFSKQYQDRVAPVRLKIRILSGCNLPKPAGAKSGETIDPYVIVTLHDVKRAEGGKPAIVTDTHTTSAVRNNGFCPVWNENNPKIFTVLSPNVASLQFSLREKDIGLDDKVAEAAIPVNCLRKGYRSVQLYDLSHSRMGPYHFASLLVEIQIIELQ